MSAAALILSPLGLVEDAILSQLQRVAPAVVTASADLIAAAWGALPAETVRRLHLYGDDPDDPDGLPWAVVAQHQDAGGGPSPHINSAGWEGLVVIKALSAADADARDGYALAAARMAQAVSPAGYRLALRWDRPIAIPMADGIYQRAGQWRATLRRTV